MSKNIFSTAEAAKFLGLSQAGIEYHIYRSGKLKPDGKIGKALYFTRDTLRKFNGKRKK